MLCKTILAASRRALASAGYLQPLAVPRVSATLHRCISCSPAIFRRPNRGKKPTPRAAPAVTHQTWDAAALSARLFRLFSVEERVYLIDEGSATVVLDALRELGFTDDQLSDILLSSPHLLRRGPAPWRGTCTVLLEHGLSPEAVLHMLVQSPALLDTRAREISARLGALVAGMSTDDAAVLELVTRKPQLLLLPENRLQRQLADLLTVFTQSQVSRVVLRCPTVLFESWSETSRKIDYFIETMGLTPSDVVFSSGMMFPLAHIRTRHLALERSGSYIRPRAKDTAPSGNATLTDIVDHPDQVFCKRVARLPLREYEVFCRLVEEEFAAQDRAAERDGGESDADSDEGSDSDSESDLDEPGGGYGKKTKKPR